MTIKQVTIIEMGNGQTGKIIGLNGGYGLTNRLDSIGIRPGKTITKISGMPMHGPVTIQVDSTQVAIGFGVAQKIMVEV